MLALGSASAATPTSELHEFNIPAGPADRALLALAKQAGVALLFSSDSLRQVQSQPVTGRYSCQDALDLLLRDTGFVANRSGEGKWIIVAGPPAGKIKGRILAPDGSSARRVRVSIPALSSSVFSSETGTFELSLVPPGTYDVVVSTPLYRPLQFVGVVLPASEVVDLGTHALQRIEDPTQLEPFVVNAAAPHALSLDHSEAQLAPPRAAGNLDLPRTESGPLPYSVFNQTQIERSGVVNLNEFLHRELIDSAAGSLSPDQDPSLVTPLYRTGSTNLGLRGYNRDETVILVNGRPLPEVLTSHGTETLPPDVNLIPLSLVQQVQVLPVSASSLYSGNAIGGVINIVLRPDVDTNITEVALTYTNAVRHFDAPQTSLSLLNAQSLLGGAFRVRLNATFFRNTPATEAELGYRQKHIDRNPDLDSDVYGATPNVRSVRPKLLTLTTGATDDPAGSEPTSATNTGPGQPPPPSLFGPNGPPVTSVAVGADGKGGINSFAGRAGIRDTNLFDSVGAFSAGNASLDFPYGRREERETYFGSFVYDPFSWLQLGLDATHSLTVAHRGYEVMQGSLSLAATSPLNPFQQDIKVSLNETAPALGKDYTEARIGFSSLVGGALIRLPRDWRLMLDAQYAHNVVKYRGLVGADATRWQKLVDSGGYNPLRDTQVYGPPAAFYDQVLVYAGARGRFVTMGDYDTLDLAARVTNEALSLPTGRSVVNVGADFRLNHLASYTEEKRYSDGELASDPDHWSARTLERYSFFGELQTPLIPAKHLPRWMKQVETDLALRYVAANSRKEANWAPTYGIRIGLPAGFSFRGSITTSSRYPTPYMSHHYDVPTGGGPGEGDSSVNRQFVNDYVRGEKYYAVVKELENPNLQPMGAVTQSAGLVFQRGQVHCFRVAIDFVDTHKTNEDLGLDQEMVTSHESLWPERVIREAAAKGDAAGVGRIVTVYTGRVNLFSRYSQDWTTSLDYRWNACFGGTFEAYARLLYYQRYLMRTYPDQPRIDQLETPDGLVPHLLKYRSNFGVAWSNKLFSFGSDGHYYHSRLLPVREWVAQGRSSIRPYWQFDAFTQADLAHWLPWHSRRYGLKAQLRVNNLLGTPYPKYANEGSGAGVEAYGDWRGRVYSLSVTASF